MLPAAILQYWVRMTVLLVRGLPLSRGRGLISRLKLLLPSLVTAGGKEKARV
jgi:hypothetical protein